jgi:hypothetical protein
MLLLNFCFEYGVVESAWAPHPSRPGLVHPAESEMASPRDRGRHDAQILHGIVTSAFLSH